MNPTILIVDDDLEDFKTEDLSADDSPPGYMAYYVLELDEAGYDVVTAHGPQEALDYIDTLAKDAKLSILIDVLMPPEAGFDQDNPEGMRTGLFLAERIRNKLSTTQVVRLLILSNNVPPNEQGAVGRADCQKLLQEKKIDRVLFKPDTTPQKLIEILNDIWE